MADFILEIVDNNWTADLDVFYKPLGGLQSFFHVHCLSEFEFIPGKTPSLDWMSLVDVKNEEVNRMCGIALKYVFEIVQL